MIQVRLNNHFKSEHRTYDSAYRAAVDMAERCVKGTHYHYTVQAKMPDCISEIHVHDALRVHHRISLWLVD